jgi:hypothetical protein
MKKSVLAVLLVLLLSNHVFAASVMCNIEIEDVSKGVKYNVQHKPKLSGELDVDKFGFDVPGSDYRCWFTFFGLGNGSAIACEYNKDMGYTFFQSDRSVMKESPVKNNLSFRHKGSFIGIKTVCEDEAKWQ